MYANSRIEAKEKNVHDVISLSLCLRSRSLTLSYVRSCMRFCAAVNDFLILLFKCIYKTQYLEQNTMLLSNRTIYS